MATNRIETLDPALIRPGKPVYCIVVACVSLKPLVVKQCIVVAWVEPLIVKQCIVVAWVEPLIVNQCIVVAWVEPLIVNQCTVLQ